ncbi:malectin domain-containing carbohydrate-binding protein [Nocardioides sp. MAHUQ-72]|uniref:malectin domain-containing carbohydrate-binding protein n=1 Tax=unclassified Nocardioides TaxID=2615069 RepID=UPI00361877D7
MNADHGNRIVSVDPVRGTPHVMDGAVLAITQVGNRVIAAGTFTKVSPADTYTDTSDDITRNGMFAFDATTGAIDMAFNPNIGGEVRSVDTDGTSIYAAGSFKSVGGKTGFKRLVKLDLTGTPVTNFKAVPSATTNEVVVRGGRVYVGGGFTSIKSRTVTYPVAHLAALDPERGTPTNVVSATFAGVYNPSASNPGTTNVRHFDVTADGSRLIAIGNFATVNGAAHNQIVMLDTSGATASVMPWSTNRFDRSHSVCAGVFDTFTRDVDFSPDGSYYVVTTTGAFAGGAGSSTMCDTSSRWETDQTGNDPTWIDYTGGDTTFGLAVTGAAVYVGGHMRWENNPFQGDQAGPGAVPREGIAALDPVNGLPLSWNPGRDRGVGAQALFATGQGLWVGSDTTLFHNQRRGRIAFVPLAGGSTIPDTPQATLPNDLFGMGQGTAPANVLYRYNAGGSTVAATDGGPSWVNPPGNRLSGGSNATYTTPVTLDSTVPASTPPQIFLSERYGQQDWNLPVTAGTPITVRLYFANQYAGTSQPGQRVFNVLIDNVARLSNFDIVAAAGDKTGTMREFSIVSDGNVDIDLRNVTDNALVNGVEILNNNAAGGSPGTLQRRSVDASGAPTGAATTVDSTVDWSKVRGAFLLNGTLYYGLSDAALYKRSFDAATGTFGSQSAVNLYDDPDNGARIPFAISTMTGMFYDPALHRIYYTVSGDTRLFYRYFTPESEVVGAQTFTADAGGVSFSAVAGMTLASGRILYGSSDGALRSVPFSGGRVTGTPTVLSSDGTWKFRGLFLKNG